MTSESPASNISDGPTVDVVIRTYYRDFRWLRLTLLAIETFLTDYRQVLLIMPASSVERWRSDTFPPGINSSLIVDQDYADDYLGQQICKLHADTLTDADYLLHLDSDCVFVRPTSVWDDLFRDGKPLHGFLTRSRRPSFDGWRQSVNDILGIDTAYEFMVTMPPLYPRELYEQLRGLVSARNGRSLRDLMMARRADTTSEFSILGAYAYFHCRSAFSWFDVAEIDVTTWPCHQFWSRGGPPERFRQMLPQALTRAFA